MYKCIRIIDACGKTPMHYAAVASTKGMVFALRSLLDHPSGAEASAMTDKSGATPLHVAGYIGLARVAAKVLRDPAAASAPRPGGAAAYAPSYAPSYAPTPLAAAPAPAPAPPPRCGPVSTAASRAHV